MDRITRNLTDWLLFLEREKKHFTVLVWVCTQFKCIINMFENAKDGSISRSHSKCTWEMRVFCVLKMFFFFFIITNFVVVMYCFIFIYFCFFFAFFLLIWLCVWRGRGVSRSFLYSNNLSRLDKIHSSNNLKCLFSF
jgi:hypothetical protein